MKTKGSLSTPLAWHGRTERPIPRRKEGAPSGDQATALETRLGDRTPANATRLPCSCLVHLQSVPVQCGMPRCRVPSRKRFQTRPKVIPLVSSRAQRIDNCDRREPKVHHACGTTNSSERKCRRPRPGRREMARKPPATSRPSTDCACVGFPADPQGHDR